jgi:hypothetical protein
MEEGFLATMDKVFNETARIYLRNQVAKLRNKLMHDCAKTTRKDAIRSRKCDRVMEDKVLPHLLTYYHLKKGTQARYEWHYNWCAGA